MKKRNEDVEVLQRLCVSLPSEILGQLWRFSKHSLLLDTECFDRLSHEHHNAMAETLQCQNLLGLGLHGDGVPCNWDRTESVSMLSINLPGVPGYNGRLRIPVVIVPDWCIGEHSLDDIMEVLAWDLRSLLSGSCASCRHDGSPWQKTDAQRSKQSGVLREFKAHLVQVRGDWDWFAKCFHFGTHNQTVGLCWRCNVRRDQVLA